jgi:hypothetical protein
MALYKYNTYGWYAGQCDASEPRSTAAAPENTSQSTDEGAIRANWTGYEWVERGYIEPAAPADSAPYYGRIITRLAFLNRFTDAEAVAVDLASIGATVQAATLRRAQAKINAAEEIQLDNAETRAGVQALETAGLLAAGRAAAILDSGVQSSEVPARYRATYGLPEVPA